MQTLLEEGAGGGRLRVTEVVVSPGAEMREHDHGASEALLVPLAGELLLASGDHRETIASGTVVLLDKGERVRLANRSSEPFTMVMVFTRSTNRLKSGGRVGCTPARPTSSRMTQPCT